MPRVTTLGMGVSTHTAPSDLDLRGKGKAHLANVQMWRSRSGRESLLPQEEYWTWIHYPDQSVEIPNLIRLGIVSDLRQVHGVNEHLDVIEKCRGRYPNIHLYHGKWCHEVLRVTPCPNGGIVYLDTQNQPDGLKSQVSSTNTIRTLEKCGANTLVCVTLCMSAPYLGLKDLSPEKYLQNISSGLTTAQRDRWELLSYDDGGGFQESYRYRGEKRYVQMGTFFFWSVS